jgi:hypothetical protein
MPEQVDGPVLVADPVVSDPPPPHAGMMFSHDAEDTVVMRLAAVHHVVELLRQGDKYGALKYMLDALDGAMNQDAEPQEYPKYVEKPDAPHIKAIAENPDHEAEIYKGWGVAMPKAAPKK